MFKEIRLLNGQEIAQLQSISASANYVDGKISNPHSKVKNNLQLHDNEAYARSSKILMGSLMVSQEFRDFAFPKNVAPPMMTRYTPGMHYGLHTDASLIPLAKAQLRADISCTIFLSDPESYDGGALHIRLGGSDLRFKGKSGTAIVYPSNTFHQVEEVTKGERHVAITFIESYIADVSQRNLLYELNEVAALEGDNMSFENFTRLQGVQSNLGRMWMK
ncbi:MAG: Fe2+-dependent dioxygenase [Acidimicrobiales bacterium]|nr:Fe2+-dependent dioxygenase [Hyphomonadaceae bacterium]RZV44331.1 MAG: Fe2+-dependent dioxygenase [Acidimicrobiales bacterium]